MQKDDRMLLTTDEDPLGRVPPGEWDCDMGCPVTCDDCMGKGSCTCDHRADSPRVNYVRLPDRNGHRTVRVHICAGDGYVPPHARKEHAGLILRAVSECREVRCDGPHYSAAVGAEQPPRGA